MATKKRTPKRIYLCYFCPNCGVSNQVGAVRCSECKRKMGA